MFIVECKEFFGTDRHTNSHFINHPGSLSPLVRIGGSGGVNLQKFNSSTAKIGWEALLITSEVLIYQQGMSQGLLVSHYSVKTLIEPYMPFQLFRGPQIWRPEWAENQQDSLVGTNSRIRNAFFHNSQLKLLSSPIRCHRIRAASLCAIVISNVIRRWREGCPGRPDNLKNAWAAWWLFWVTGGRRRLKKDIYISVYRLPYLAHSAPLALSLQLTFCLCRLERTRRSLFNLLKFVAAYHQLQVRSASHTPLVLSRQYGVEILRRPSVSGCGELDHWVRSAGDYWSYLCFARRLSSCEVGVASSSSLGDQKSG